MNARTTRPLGIAAVLAAAVALVGCNEHPLTPLGDTLVAARVELSPRIISNAVDILWLVDDSGSMREEQAELGARFNEFIEALADLEVDFRMAVVTTDLNKGGVFRTRPGPVQSRNCFEPPGDLSYCSGFRPDPPFLQARDYRIDPDDPSQGIRNEQLANDFRCIALAGDCGDGIERGLDSLREALSPQQLAGPNRGFLRDDAFLLVIMLTDEDDCSNNPAFTISQDADCYARERRGDLTPVQEYYDFFVDLKGGSEDKVLIAGLIGDSDGLELQTYAELGRDGPRFSCNATIAAGNGVVSARDGKRYRDLISFAGVRGLEQSICQSNFSAALASIGRILSENLDINCLSSAPRTCNTSADCGQNDVCLQPPSADPTRTKLYCSSFELAVEIQPPEGGPFVVLTSPGTAEEAATPRAGAEYTVDYSASVCPHDIAFRWAPGSRPRTNSRYRVTYPVQIDIITARETEDEQ